LCRSLRGLGHAMVRIKDGDAGGESPYAGARVAHGGPRHWNHMELRHGNLQVTGDGARVTYTGKGQSDQDAASVRTDRPFDLASAACHYFEVTVVARGRDGYIGIGVCSGSMAEAIALARNPEENIGGAVADAGTGVEGARDGAGGAGVGASGPQLPAALMKQLGRLPGWEASSWGYHGDDGFKFHGSGTGTGYGPQYSTGDTAGCLYNAIEGTLMFTRNGVELGVAFTGVTLPMALSQQQTGAPPVADAGATGGERLKRLLRLPLYPMVGLRTPGECVEANFGQRPFVYDFAGYVAAAKGRLLAQVARVRFPEYLSIGNYSSERQRGDADGMSDGFGAAGAVPTSGLGGPSCPAGAKKVKPAPTPSGGVSEGADASKATAISSSAMETDNASRGSRGGVDSEDTTTRGMASMGITSSSSPGVSPRGAEKTGMKSESHPVMPALVLEYLLFHGHRRSAAALATATRLEVSEDLLEDCSARRAVMELAMAGDIDGARAAAEVIVPGLLIGRPDLSFLLGCQKFVELVRAGDDAATLAFGQELGRVDRAEVERCASSSRRVTHAGESCARAVQGFPSVNRKLEEIFSLLAYSPPESAPLGYLLEPERRAEVANSLNAALVWAQGRRPNSSLDTLDRQVRVARKVLGEIGSSAASLIDVDHDFLNELGPGVTN